MTDNNKAETVIRRPRPDEYGFLCDLWQTAFGNEGKAAFFKHFFKREHTLTALYEGMPAAMGYIIPAGELATVRKSLPCAMLFGIAVLPLYRSCGLGTAVTNALISEAFKLGYTAVTLCPSEESLFDYYRSKTGLREWFYAAQELISAAPPVTAPASAAAGTSPQPIPYNTPAAPYQTPPEPYRTQEQNTLRINRLTAEEYKHTRERLLEGTVHIKHNIKCLEYQQMLCDELGGGLYGIGGSCAVIEAQPDGAVWVKELLIGNNDDRNSILKSINTAFPSLSYLYRYPYTAYKPDKQNNKQGASRFAMLVLQDDVSDDFYDIDNINILPWYGLAFD